MPIPSEDSSAATNTVKKTRGFNVHLVLIMATFIATAGIFAFYTLYKTSKLTTDKVSDKSPFNTLLNKDAPQASDSIMKPGQTRMDGIKVYAALGNGTEFLAYYTGYVQKITGRTLTLVNKETKVSGDVTLPNDLSIYVVDTKNPDIAISETKDYSEIKIGDYVSYSVGNNDEYNQNVHIYRGVAK